MPVMAVVFSASSPWIVQSVDDTVLAIILAVRAKCAN